MTPRPGQSPEELSAWTATIQARIDAALAEVEPGQPCPTCDGRGHVIWVYPRNKPTPAHWFQRGPNNERPGECEACGGTGSLLPPRPEYATITPRG